MRSENESIPISLFPPANEPIYCMSTDATITPAELSSVAHTPWVVCLCAQWCGLCRDYATLFAQMAPRYPSFRFVWLDVEEQADLLGDLDVETFPTLLLADAGGTRFFGPLTPQASTLSRLLESLHSGGLQTAPHTPVVRQLLEAVQAAPAHWITG